tara:strand:+ start:1012 stop:3126 length:2115 start_codon:yes stop_codon:yes gene_type:complete
MPTNRRILSQDAAVSAAADSAEGLVLHLDANDEDSIESGGANTGAGSGTWFDIANHDLNVPLVDKASNLKVHLNASDTTSYGGSGSTWTDISGSGLNATISGASFGSDTRGYFDFSGAASDLITIPDSSFVDMESNSTMEVWLQKPTTTCHIINKGAGDGNESYAFWAQSNKVYFYRYDDGTGFTNLNISTSSIATDEYIHVVVTVGSSGDFKMYLNGGSQVSDSISTFRDNSNSVRIGNFNTSNQHPYTERLSVVRFYNTALTASEVAQNYRAGNFFSFSSIYSTNALIDYRPSNYSGSGTSITNLGTLSNDAVILGGVESTYDKELGDFFFIDGSGTTGDGIETTNAVTGVNLNTDGFSWEVWAKFTAQSQGYLTSFNYDTTYYNLSFRSDRSLQFMLQGLSGMSNLSAGTLDLNRWYHIVATADSNGHKIFIDGIRINQNSTAAVNHDLNSDIYFGIYHNTSINSDGIHTGNLGDMRFHKGALSEAQVAQNYLATKNDYPNGHNATIYGSTFGTNLSSPNESRFVFDGNNDYMELDTYVHPNIPLYSISMFIKFADATPSTTNYFLSNITTSNNEINSNIHFGLLSSGNFVVMVGDGSGVDSLQTASGLSDDTYAHLVFTFDGVNDEVKYYKDGSLQSTTSSITRIGGQNAQADLYIGRYGESSLFYSSLTLGQFKIFHKVLSASEVTAEFDANKATYGLS